MTDEEITALVETIEALEPQTKEIVLQFVDLLLQVKETGIVLPTVPTVKAEK